MTAPIFVSRRREADPCQAERSAFQRAHKAHQLALILREDITAAQKRLRAAKNALIVAELRAGVMVSG